MKQQVMLRERKDLEGPKPHRAGMTTAEIYSSQKLEKKPTKTASRIQDLRKQQSFKKNNNQVI